MNILLIGHEGYVGKGLHQVLSKQNRVIGWGSKQNILLLNSRTITENKIEAVVNCATVADRTNECFKVNSECHEVNVKGMYNLVNSLKDLDVKLVFISTKDVFGNCINESDVIEKEDHYALKDLIDDDCPFAPITAYAKTKLTGEFVSESHPQSIVIRLSTCYTEADSHRANLVPHIIKSYLRGGTFKVTNKGKQIRDFLHVSDLGRLIESFLESNCYGRKINLGGGLENSLSLLQIMRMLNPDAQLETFEGGDYGFAFNNRLAKELFGWTPRKVFSEILPRIVDNITNSINLLQTGQRATGKEQDLA
jgi:nucleoside-diphosphate-sugar epimerase